MRPALKENNNLHKLLVNGNYGILLKALEKAVANNPVISLLALKIKTLIRLGKYNLSKEILDKYITDALDNKNFNILRTLFILYSQLELEKGKTDSAIKYIEKVANDLDQLNYKQEIDYHFALLKLRFSQIKETSHYDTALPDIPPSIKSEELKHLKEFYLVYLTYMRSEDIQFASISNKLNHILKLTKDIEQKLEMLYELSDLLYKNNKFELAHSYITKAADCINYILSRLSLEDSFYYINSPKSHRVILLHTHIQSCLNNNNNSYLNQSPQLSSLYELTGQFSSNTPQPQFNTGATNKNTSLLYNHLNHESLPFKSQPMREISDRLKSASALDTIVTIIEGSDYERDVLARYLHSLSPRNSRPFIKIDCSDHNESNLNALLFGENDPNNEDVSNPLFICDGGTLFIEHIEKTAPEIQLKILDFIETKKIKVHKQKRPVPTDIRMVIGCAINLQNSSSSNKQLFAAKFINKIKHTVINIPALKERKEDISTLLDIALKEAALKHNRKQKHLDHTALNLLLQYKWPGNYDELRKLANNLHSNNKKEIITDKDIPLHIKLYNIPDEIMDDKSYLTEKVEKIEKLIITHTLLQNNNNIQKTAFTLGVDRSTLWRKIQKHNIKVTRSKD